MNRQFWLLGPNFPNKYIRISLHAKLHLKSTNCDFGPYFFPKSYVYPKQSKWTLTSNSVYLTLCRYQFLSLTESLIFWGQTSSKRAFAAQSKTSEYYYQTQHISISLVPTLIFNSQFWFFEKMPKNSEKNLASQK